MAAFDDPRFEMLEYLYEIPDFNKLNKWVSNHLAIQIEVSPRSICHGFITASAAEIWMVVGTKLVSTNDIDIHWLRWMRTTGYMTHRQQVYRLHDKDMWKGVVFTLDRKPSGDYCPTCNIEMERIMMASKCPQCWFVRL